MPNPRGDNTTRTMFVGRYELPSMGVGAIAQHYAKKKELVTEEDVNSLTLDQLRALKNFGDESIFRLIDTRFTILRQKEDEEAEADIFGEVEEKPNPITPEGLLVPLKPQDIGWLERMSVAYGATVEQGAARVIKEWLNTRDPSKQDRPDTNFNHLTLGKTIGTEHAKQGAASNTAPATGGDSYVHTFTGGDN